MFFLLSHFLPHHPVSPQAHSPSASALKRNIQKTDGVVKRWAFPEKQNQQEMVYVCM